MYWQTAMQQAVEESKHYGTLPLITGMVFDDPCTLSVLFQTTQGAYTLFVGMERHITVPLEYVEWAMGLMRVPKHGWS